jgi:hypothetical protein
MPPATPTSRTRRRDAIRLAILIGIGVIALRDLIQEVIIRMRRSTRQVDAWWEREHRRDVRQAHKAQVDFLGRVLRDRAR